MPPALSREDQAALEAGHTEISPRLARGLSLALVAAVAAVPVGQMLGDAMRGEAPGAVRDLRMFRDEARAALDRRPEGASRIFAVNRGLLQGIGDYETRLEEDSWLTHLLLDPVQLAMARTVGLGNENAYLGRDGWLFFRPDLDYVTGRGFLDPRILAARRLGGDAWRPPPEPDPVPAILDLHRQLADRGIALVVMPTPVKPVVAGDRFVASARPPLQNPSYANWIAALREAGVDVFDPTDLLVEQGAASYLMTDTHWSPAGLKASAEALAEQIRPHLGESDEIAWVRESTPWDARGDIAGMLPDGLFPTEAAVLDRVTGPDGGPWTPDRFAEVLLLGDSFTNIYSLEGLGWGTSAGLAEQLAYGLRRPVDRIAQNDAGSNATRRLLARELARGTDRLAGKRVVVWQFAVRELAFGDWPAISLELGPPPPTAFLDLDPDARVEVTAVVREATSVPRPGTVPYRDHIRSLHLQELRDPDGEAVASDAVVFVRSMTDNVWTEAAAWRRGQTVSLSLRPWTDVETELDGLNRSELDDVELTLQPILWGEP